MSQVPLPATKQTSTLTHQNTQRAESEGFLRFVEIITRPRLVLRCPSLHDVPSMGCNQRFRHQVFFLRRGYFPECIHPSTNCQSSQTLLSPTYEPCISSALTRIFLLDLISSQPRAIIRLRVAQHRTGSFHFGASISKFVVWCSCSYHSFLWALFSIVVCLATDFHGSTSPTPNSWSFHPLSRVFSQSIANGLALILSNWLGIHARGSQLVTDVDKERHLIFRDVQHCPIGQARPPPFLPVPKLAHIVPSGFLVIFCLPHNDIRVPNLQCFVGA